MPISIGDQSAGVGLKTCLCWRGGKTEGTETERDEERGRTDAVDGPTGLEERIGVGWQSCRAPLQAAHAVSQVVPSRAAMGDPGIVARIFRARSTVEVWGIVA